MTALTRLQTKLLFLLIILSPIKVVPGTTLSSVSCLKAVLTGIFLVSWGAHLLIFRESIRPFEKNPFIIFMILFLAVGVASSFNSLDPARTILNAVLMAGTFFIFYVLLQYLIDEQNLKKMISLLLIVGVGVSCIAILQGLFGIGVYSFSNISPLTVVSGGLMVNATLIYSNALGSYLAMLLPIPIGLLIFSRPQRPKVLWLLVILVAIMSIALLSSGSRGSWLRLGLCLLLLGAFRSWKVTAAILTLIAILGLIFVGTLVNGYLAKGVLDYKITTWSAAVEIIKDHPFLGTGLGTFSQASMKYWTDYPECRQAHNLWLGFGSEMGLAAPLLFLWFCIAYLGRLIRILRGFPSGYWRGLIIGLLVSFIGLLAHSFFESSHILSLGPGDLTFWVLVAMGIGVKKALGLRLDRQTLKL